jgi:hypothetical protein
VHDGGDPVTHLQNSQKKDVAEPQSPKGLSGARLGGVCGTDACEGGCTDVAAAAADAAAAAGHHGVGHDALEAAGRTSAKGLPGDHLGQTKKVLSPGTPPFRLGLQEIVCEVEEDCKPKSGALKEWMNVKTSKIWSE